MSTQHHSKIENFEELRKRVSSKELTAEDISNIDQLIVAQIELQKALASSTEKIGEKTVLAKLPFGVDLVK